jgi:hypothetical protein
MVAPACRGLSAVCRGCAPFGPLRALPFDFAVIFCAGRDPRPVDALQNPNANGAYLTVLDDLSFRLEEQRRQATYSLGSVVL